MLKGFLISSATFRSLEAAVALSTSPSLSRSHSLSSPRLSFCTSFAHCVERDRRPRLIGLRSAPAACCRDCAPLISARESSSGCWCWRRCWGCLVECSGICIERAQKERDALILSPSLSRSLSLYSRPKTRVRVHTTVHAAAATNTVGCYYGDGDESNQ